MVQTENKRIENLYKYDILDTPPDGAFEEITSLTAKIFDVPVAIISLVDTDRIWFKSAYGLDVEQYPGIPAYAVPQSCRMIFIL